MGEMSDHYFVCPRPLFAADRVNIYDAINLVVYAKLPLKSVLYGKELVAGFFERDGTGATSAPLGKKQREELLGKYGKEVSSFRYPVTPSQYEPLLEMMLEAGEEAFPLFIHEHHLLIDRRARAAMFSQIHRELMEDVQKGDVILQISDSKRVRLLTSEAWVTQRTLGTYLDHQGVTPWWENQANLASHARLERILPSDALDLPSNYVAEDYDSQQLPSFVFGKMLLKRSYLPPGYRRPHQAAQGSQNSAETTASSGTSSPKRSKAPQKEPPVRTEPSAAAPVISKAPPVRTMESQASEKDVPVDDAPERVNNDSSLERDETMIGKQQVADLIGMVPGTVDNYRKNPKRHFPKPATSYGENTLRWRKRDILEWRDRHKPPKDP